MKKSIIFESRVKTGVIDGESEDDDSVDPTFAVGKRVHDNPVLYIHLYFTN